VRTEDGYIIQQCLDGDPASFSFLVEKYKKAVFALAYSRIGNFHDAQDITQEVFINAYRKLHTLRRWDNFMAWLQRITINQCKMMVRAQSKRPDREFVEDQESKALDQSSMSFYQEDILHESIQEALDLLPELYSQVLTLRYFGGMSIDEMSTFLAVSPSTIDRRLSEAKTRLREEILTMMNTLGERYELPSAFTFHIVEIVKNIRINPISPAKPLGLSLATGLIILVFGIGSNINLSNQAIPTSSMSQSAATLYNTDNIHIDLSDTPKSPYAFSVGGDGDGSGISGQQDYALMAPKGEGGKIPDKPSVQIGNGMLDGLAYSPDGKILAILTTIGIKLYDADNLNEIGMLQEDKSYRACISFSPDGKILVVGTGNGGFSLWNIKTRNRIGSIPDRQGYRVAFSPDSRILAITGEWDGNKSIYLWDIQKLEQIGTLKVDADYAHSVAFSSNGKILISVDNSKDPVRLWDIQTQKQIGTLKGNNDPIWGIAVSPDGNILATAGGDENEGELLIWNIQEQKLIGSLNGHKSIVYSVAFSSDGKILASGSCDDQTIRLWNIQERKQIALIQANKSEGYKIALKPDGKIVASLNTHDYLIRFWDVQEQKEVGIIDDGFAYYPLVAFSHDSKTFASGGGSKVILWNTLDQKQTAEIPVTEIGGFAELAYSPDGKTIACSTDKSIILIDVQKQKQIGLLKGHTDFIRSMAFSPDGKLIASGSLDTTLRLWDVQEQKEIWKQNCPSHTHAVTFTPDGKSIIVGIGANGSIIIYDVEKKEQTGVLQTPGWVSAVAISPDGQTLVSGIGSVSIIFWDFDKKRQIGSIGLGNRNDDYVVKLMFSPDGKWIIYNTNISGTCHIWDAKTRAQLGSLKGHKGSIYSMSFSPNGKWLATGSDDGTMLLWEVDIPIETRSVNHTGKAIDTWGKIKSTELFQNYPNPFNPETWIPFCLSESEDVKIRIYSLKGELVRTLHLGRKQPGQYMDRQKAAYWDGRNDQGEQVASNIYFTVMEAGKFQDVRKIVMVR